ncbi:MAG: Na+/H+ antiporter NhaC family protein, partial [Fusobacterium sp. JB020]|nr:Na+/H+ antiporter NhaC family protein [Fusobacterium sp. JB020]
IMQGTVDFLGWISAIGGGMSDMFSITIVAILVSGILGIVKENGGVDWMVKGITSRIKDRKGAEYGIGLLSGILSAALVNNTIAIIISAPIAKEIGKNYGIAPKRLASLIDIFACAFISVLPYDGGMLIVTGLAKTVSPLEVMKYMFYMFALIIMTSITIQFGLLRTPEEKKFLEKN